MVFFTCNHCGESVKKQAVAKHYLTKCRGAAKNVSCMDCQKDFLGEDYVAHIKCISEAEKYSGKDYVPKESSNSNCKKQESWMDTVRSILETKEYNLDAETKAAFERLQSMDNVPRKKAKFINYANNCLRMYQKISEKVWVVLEKEQEKMKKAKGEETAKKKASQKPAKKGEQLEVATDEPPKKKKKENAELNGTVEESNNILDLKSKKKKKKRNAEADDNVEDSGSHCLELKSNGEIPGEEKSQAKKKKKKNKENAEENGMVEESNSKSVDLKSNEKTAEEVKSQSKKKKKKNKENTEGNGMVQESNSNSVELKSNQKTSKEESKKKKKKNKESAEGNDIIEESKSNSLEPKINGETLVEEKNHSKKKKKKSNETTSEIGDRNTTVDPSVNVKDSAQSDEFDLSSAIERLVSKHPDGILVNRLQKKLLKKYLANMSLDALDEKQQKKFDKKVNKYLKKCPAVQLEGDLLKPC